MLWHNLVIIWLFLAVIIWLFSVSHNVLSHSLYMLQIRMGLTKSESEHSKVPVPVDSIMFDRLECQRLNEEYGPLDLDGAASVYDAQVPNHCSCDCPFGIK
mgnify:FL=1